MKGLLELLLTDDKLVQIAGENMETNLKENTFDPDLLKGYHDMGLVEL